MVIYMIMMDSFLRQRIKKMKKLINNLKTIFLDIFWNMEFVALIVAITLTVLIYGPEYANSCIIGLLSAKYIGGGK